jgi:uncharacterized protein (TIGR02996 family)
MAPTSFDGASIPPEMLIFFRDIKEHPDDDTPRLIFADWLQEHGDSARAARGEFMRLQVLRHRLSPDDPNYGLLKRREGELFTEHRWSWLGPLRDAAKLWRFERGFIQITAQLDQLLIPEVTAWARTEAAFWLDGLLLPEIRHAEHWAAEDQINHLAYSPLIAHLTRLDVSGNGDPIGLRLVFRALRARNLPFLSQLHLSYNRLMARQVVSLARCHHFCRLTFLDLRGNRLDDTAAGLLAESAHLQNLTALCVGHNRFTADGIALLRRAFGDRVSF